MVSYANGLTQAQLDQFDQDGCLCLPDFITPEEVKTLLDKSKQLIHEFDMTNHPLTKFSTDTDNHVGNDYFLDSSDKISFFFENDAFEDGKLTKPKEKSINKIGHALHCLDPDFEKVSFSDKVKGVSKSLQFKDPRILQSMVICKLEEIGGEVPSHTDSQFLYTKPLELCGFWFALEDCTIANGCLSYNPGSHKRFPVAKRFVKVDKGKKGCGFIDLVSKEELENVPKDNPDDYKYVECKAGSLVLIHHSVLHKSNPNTSQNSRFAYVFHVIEGEAEYDPLNWLQVPPCEDGATEFSKLY
ncbi:hypothetical protein DASC09_022970 [Saccharomycopsis crataegensis]|uniref:Phytanoyl-CoA dioxygenase n=1 Tax=Saccharomycopsis crataegensis TaxID=43959 RepID=A0AAV5QK82_9ASCO|nr:hypothetical protein DASC09_022970 [Saccharomycopsis crataegensis]